MHQTTPYQQASDWMTKRQTMTRLDSRNLTRGGSMGLQQRTATFNCQTNQGLYKGFVARQKKTLGEFKKGEHRRMNLTAIGIQGEALKLPNPK
mmetsp:Transcript_3235/g.3173  ORF Transcript_3235/g.3173 Transcript_3235/m.3173 type:complete len:93 (-) Transcript_3235:44-322(-)